VFKKYPVFCISAGLERKNDLELFCNIMAMPITCFIIFCINVTNEIRDSSVGIATATGWTAEGSEVESRYGQDFFPLHFVQTGSKAHPASYPMDIEGSFPEAKAAGA
jgi:hypothetical protein